MIPWDSNRALAQPQPTLRWSVGQPAGASCRSELLYATIHTLKPKKAIRIRIQIVPKIEVSTVPPAMMTKKMDRTNVAFLRHSDIRPHRRAAINPNREIETPKTRPEIGMNGQISSSRP